MTPSAAPRGFVLANLGFVAAMVVVAALSAWPLYAEWHFVLVVIVGAGVGGGIAVLSWWRGWGLLVTAGAVVGAYLVLGVFVAVPTALTGFVDVLTGWLSLVTGTVLSWKQLVTISTLPVGDYQTLLVPAFLVMLLGTVALVSIALRARRLYALLAPVALAMNGFGLLFGSSAVSAPGPLGIVSPREIALGSLAFLVVLAYLLWRGSYDRRVAIRASRAAIDLGRGRHGATSAARRIALAAGTLVVALVVAIAVGPALDASADRRVLRSSVSPTQLQQLAVSPLSSYREFFGGTVGDTTPGLYDTDLLTVDASGLGATELRLAVLSHYDGQEFRAIDPAQGPTEASAFVRVPYSVDPPVEGPTGEARVTVDHELAGAWLPTLRDMEKIDFTGQSARANASGFYYNVGVQAGIVSRSDGSAGLAVGDSYRMTAVQGTQVAPEDVGAPPASKASAGGAPDSLAQWMEAQGTTDLAELVTRLRSRGYLSHSLADPQTTSWYQDLAEPQAQSSFAGHSTARIGEIFTALLARQQLVGAGADSSQLVAAVGDDEQFAVAAALLAQRLGYPARVVLGFRVGSWSLDPASDEPVCAATCQGKNLAAWIEVQNSSGRWVSVDTTPQHAQTIQQLDTSKAVPRFTTDVTPESAQRQKPDSGDQATGQSTSSEAPAPGSDLGWLVSLLQIGGLSLLALVVLLAPFATILAVKVRRRLDRRRAERVEAQIVGGWDEYLDAAVDHGFSVTPVQTRSQVAEQFRTTHGAALALLADRAVFGPVEPQPGESEEFWRMVEADRLEFARGMNRVQRWVAAISLRSFSRYIPQSVRRARRGRPDSR